jgi:hypothetical protein
MFEPKKKPLPKLMPLHFTIYKKLLESPNLTRETITLIASQFGIIDINKPFHEFKQQIQEVVEKESKNV